MVITLFSCPNIEQDQWNTWVSFTSADSPLVGQFSVSAYTHKPLADHQT
jgi:DNA helicase-2/ATP-dependent DNA helicase PcrA